MGGAMLMIEWLGSFVSTDLGKIFGGVVKPVDIVPNEWTVACSLESSMLPGLDTQVNDAAAQLEFARPFEPYLP